MRSVEVEVSPLLKEDYIGPLPRPVGWRIVDFWIEFVWLVEYLYAYVNSLFFYFHKCRKWFASLERGDWGKARTEGKRVDLAMRCLSEAYFFIIGFLRN